MKKFGIGLLVLVIVLGGAAVLLYTNLDRAVKGAVEEVGPRFTGTPVTLESVSLSPFSGRGSLSELVIGSPQGFTSSRAMRLGQIDVAIDTASLRSDTVVIENLLVREPEITYEAGPGGNNLKVIQNNLGISAGDSAAQSGGDSSGSDGKKIIIRAFSLTGGKVHYAHPALGGKTLALDLPAIELEGIGEKSRGVTAAEASAQILAEINRKVMATLKDSSAARDLGKQYEDQFNEKKDELKSQFENLKGLFDR